MTGTAATSYTYDADGNTLTVSDPALDGATQYGYDGLNWQVSVSGPNVSAAYAYDVDGLRTSKTVCGVTTSFVWDGDQLVLEQTGTTVKKYIRGLNLAACVDGQTVTYYLFNAHGDVIQLTDAAGEVTKSYEYDAFGVEENPSAADSNPFRYCGEYYDAETDTYYLRARNYAPTAGRFLREDPAQSGLNWYIYCYNNPVRLYDPSGLEQIVVSGGAYNPGHNPYQYEFIDSALLQISKLSGGATLLVANAGWTDDQYNNIVQAAADRNINLVWFSKTDELTNYINYGGINGYGNRANDPITGFYVFAHGTTDEGTDNYAIMFGYHSNQVNQLKWYTEDISLIQGSAFSSSCISAFYSCRTGNSFKNGNFAQAWADTTGGGTYAFYGLNGRSEYSDINGTKWERHVYGGDAFNNWSNQRGPRDASPGEAWSLPHAARFSDIGYYSPYGTIPDPQPGPTPQ